MNKIILAIALTILSISFVKNEVSYAKSIDGACKNIEVIFSRGSGQALNDGDVKQYFKQIGDRISKSTASISTYELGTEEYAGHKYQAIQVGEAPWGNAIGAKVSSGYANDYGKSVDSGVGELYSYLTQRHAKCKSQGTKFVLGGYSQGAQVIGQALPKFTTDVRNSIVYAALFGDPKLHLPEGEGINPPACQGKNLSFYRRVIANCNVDNGSLGARKPYLPEDMKKKSGLWCYDHDYVCGVTHNVFDNEGHGKYKDADMAIDQAAIEIATKLKAQLPTNIGGTIDTKPHGSASGKPDVAYIIDTTGSMGGRINKTKEFVRAASAKIQELHGRVALVAYRDQGDTYTAKVVSPFSSDLTHFRSQLDQLTAEGGGDWPEATLHALTTAFNTLEWRNGATKAAVVLTDAPYHNPDMVDESTLRSVAKRALEIDPVNVYPVVPDFLQEDYRDLAEQTSGQVIVDTGDTVGALDQALTKIKERPVALLKNVEYTADPGQEITFDASDSYIVDGEITKYQWDFDGDGTFESETTTPVINHTYIQKFDGVMQVRLTANNGTISSASAVVKVGTYTVPVLPKQPTNIKATIVSTKNNISTVKLSWKAADALADKWAVSVNGVVLGTVKSDQLSIEITDIQRTEETILGVAGVMADGTVGGAGMVTVAKSASAPAVPSWWQALLDCINKIIQTLVPRIWLGNL